MAITTILSAILILVLKFARPSGKVIGVCLEGDTSHRLNCTLRLFKDGFIDSVLVTGGSLDKERDNIPAEDMKKFLVKSGINPNFIYVDAKSMSTYEHPENVFVILETIGRDKILLITSGYHIPRAYLRFIKFKMDNGRQESIYAYSACSIFDWFRYTKTHSKSRIKAFLQEEMVKIRTYSGLASLSSAIGYCLTLIVSNSLCQRIY